MAAILAAAAAADEGVLATLDGDGAVITDEGGEVSLTVDLTRPVAWRLWIADEPPRLVLELADTEWTDEPVLRSTSVVALDVVETGPAVSELQATLREPLSVLSAEMIAEDDGTATILVRLQPTTADVFQSDLEAASDTVALATKRPVIAIDPGHGGRDPGAEAGNIQEADLMLAFAERLRDILVASGQLDVVLTRADDSFVSLDARLTRARQAGADVLLSLHADALADANAASGIVLYRLDPDATAAANLRLRERHGPSDQLSGLDLSGAGEDVTLALLDLARQRAAPRTEAMSGAILQALQGADLVVNSRPERNGEFAVLKAADIPSLLIELGFLSTEEDLERLTSEDWQTSVAEAIRDGLLLWIEEDQLK
ncbi:MAG: N-acetylmuramoyl-L-alanine amidase [Pseudomonadota bacterium]